MAKQSCWAFSRLDRAGLERGRAANYLCTLCNLKQQTFFCVVEVCFFFAARLSGHRFSSKEEEEDALIYKHNPVYCNPEITHFEQCYIF